MGKYWLFARKNPYRQRTDKDNRTKGIFIL